MAKSHDLANRFARSLMPNYPVPKLALSHGDGAVVYDVDGKSYVDFTGGIAVSSLGHNHPALVAAVTSQVAKIAHTSNLFMHEPEVELAERLLTICNATGKVFFANSGTEANECALKLALTYANATGRRYFIAATNGFHGRSLGALALTGKSAIRDPFGPYGIDVRFVPYGDAAALKAAVTSECAAVFLEPTQGEAGVIPPPANYFAAARQICDGTGALFVDDEIQAGIGRSGSWFEYQKSGVQPDVLTVAKGLGGGLPIGACIGFDRYGDLFAPGAHGSTFGGNPIASAAALAVLDTIESDGLLDYVSTCGAYLANGITQLGHREIAEVRGSGLWLGIVLASDIAALVCHHLFEDGILANPVQPNVIRLAPPFVVSNAQIDELLRALPAALDAAVDKEPT